MNSKFPEFRTITFLGIAGILACLYTYTVSADSTITIPVTDKRQVTLSLKIPPKTEPITREELKTAPIRSNLVGKWDDNPSPKIDANDEFLTICRTFVRKGWSQRDVNKIIVSKSNPDKYFMMGVFQGILESVVEIGKAKNFTRTIKKCNLTVSDIEDLRRMIKRFEYDLIRFGSNPALLDKDLLVIQESLKASRQQGILRVIKVEGTDEGSTLIHLSVE